MAYLYQMGICEVYNMDSISFATPAEIISMEWASSIQENLISNEIPKSHFWPKAVQ